MILFEDEVLDLRCRISKKLFNKLVRYLSLELRENDSLDSCKLLGVTTFPHFISPSVDGERVNGT